MHDNGWIRRLSNLILARLEKVPDSAIAVPTRGLAFVDVECGATTTVRGALGLFDLHGRYTIAVVGDHGTVIFPDGQRAKVAAGTWLIVPDTES